MTVETPCIRLCRLDEAEELCIGCGRRIEEIAGWAGLTLQQRSEIMAMLPARLSAYSVA